MKILIVEDEEGLLNSLKEFLKTTTEFSCDTAMTYSGASQKAWDNDYNLIILDIMLPDGNGLELLEEIKENSPKAGIIIISAKDSLDDRLSGLDLGADDYLTKPFHMAELMSRIKALNRRLYFHGKKNIVYNEIEIDPENHTVSVNNKILILTKKEYELLLFFIVNKNRVLTKESIAEHLWGDNSDYYQNFDFIYTHIRNLRKKIRDCGAKDYIKTVYGLGYKYTDR